MEFEKPPELVFPTALDSFKDDRSFIRSQLRDSYNRLHSIAHDADFVHDEVAPAFPDFPVVANQRAGAWYVKPSDKQAHAYFKSTDGHTNEHNFNLRRANLALLPLIKERQGIILVDSTRRGKRFPDALSKTIPIWCAVLNRARTTLLPPHPDNSTVSAEEWEEQGKLFTSPQAVGRSEHSQIEVQIDKWAKELVNSAYDLAPLLSHTRPLRPLFVSPSSTLSSPQPASFFPSYYPIVCCSCSTLCGAADSSDEWVERARGFTYVQGSGDDHEAWSKGLTPAVFWRNSEEILKASREEIDEVIARIMLEEYSLEEKEEKEEKEGGEEGGKVDSKRIRGTNLALSFAVDPASLPSSPSADAPLITVAVSNSVPASSAPPSDSLSSPSEPIHLVARPGKAGYSSFFSPSPTSPLNIVVDAATERLKEGKEVKVAVLKSEERKQSEANDLGVAVALILLVRLFDSSGALLPADAPPPLASKDLIRARLQWLLEVFPTVNPSRASLNKVNEFLMSRGRS